jgi:hypothetical protein
MSSDDRETPSEVQLTTLEPPERAAGPAELLAVPPAAPPALVEPRLLAEGIRHLQQRIPQFTQLTVTEKRSRGRAANLDPQFIEAGIQAAAAWPDTTRILQRGAEDLRQEQEEIRRWDDTLVELRALTDGIAAANLNRKHRLGEDILLLYSVLGTLLSGTKPKTSASMRPYYDNMKRAYLRALKRGRRRGAKGEGEGREE